MKLLPVIFGKYADILGKGCRRIMTKKIFNVTAQRTPQGNWTLVEPTLGAVSEVRNLSLAAADMVEPVAYLAGIKESEVEINIIPVLSEEIRGQLAEVEVSRKDAQPASKRAAVNIGPLRVQCIKAE